MASYLLNSRIELLRRIGNISQIAGAKRYILADGRGQGTECVDVRTGTGFEYTVMPGRGMDISWCGYKGIPLSYISKVGVSSPSYFTGVKDQWRQCFPGGMLSTCGLSNVGTFCEDNNIGIGVQNFGQHGRISNQCAKNICVNELWKGDIFEVSVSGTVCEAQLRAENFTLKRTVTSRLGEDSLKLDDVITNEDFLDRPCMFLYHINFGYPIVDANSVILTDEHEQLDISTMSLNKRVTGDHTLTAPINGISEKLYYYKSPEKELASIAIYNRQLHILAYIRYNTNTMPYLTEWKMLGESDYVVGLEIGNCIPKGRKYHREHHMLPFLHAQGQILNHLEIGVITKENEISAFLKCDSMNLRKGGSFID